VQPGDRHAAAAHLCEQVVDFGVAAGEVARRRRDLVGDVVALPRCFGRRRHIDGISVSSDYHGACDAAVGDTADILVGRSQFRVGVGFGATEIPLNPKKQGDGGDDPEDDLDQGLQTLDNI